MKTELTRRIPGLASRLLTPVLLAMLFSGCATPNPVQIEAQRSAPPSGAVPMDVLGQAEAMDPSSRPADEETKNLPGEQVGMVRPGLYLRVAVLVAGQPEFSEPSRQVSAQGTLDVPLIGKVQVAGMTLQQVEQKLTERFSQYLVQPQVVVEYVHSEGSSISPWGYVTVLGRVRSPGKLPIPPTRDLTVSGAIQQAGGFDTSARSSSIRVTRQLADGKTQRLKVDLKSYAKGDLEEDIVLKAGDVVFVPESVW